MSNIGKVKDWHQPRGDCQHNADVTQDCNCKRPMIRKPYRVVRVTDNGVGHNINPNLVIEIYPQNGTIVFREQRRKKRYPTTASDIYAMLVRRSALAAAVSKRRKRARK